MTEWHGPRPGRDGFTLTELLIVVSVMGVLAAAIAVSFSVIVRTVPPTEARADDARSLLGVSTWLPADVSSTPQVPVASAGPNWDDAPTRTSGCGTDPGVNIVRLAWRESLAGAPVTYVANYRLVDDAGGATSRIVRVSCSAGGPADVLNLTADLPPSTDDPVDLQWKIQTRDGVDHIVGLMLEITTLRNETLRVDAASQNPNATLGTVPAAVTTTSPATSTTTSTTSTTTSTTTTVPTGSTTTVVNQAPTAGPVAVTAQRDVASFSATVPAGDPNGDPLTVTLGTLPTGWSATISGLDVTFTAANPAAGTYPIDYTVTDPAMATASSVITVQLTPVPCVASIVAVAPNPVARTGKGNPAYPLAASVNVDMSPTGDCGNVVLRYRPTTADRTLVFGGSLRVTIPATPTEPWDSGSRTLELVLSPSQPTESILDTAVLTVLKN